MNPNGVSPLRMLSATVAYALAGALGLILALPPGYASPIFPAAGLAVALVLCYGPRILPSIYLGSVAINLGTAWQHGNLGGRTVVVALGLGLGAALQAWFAGFAVNRLVGERWKRLETEGDIIRVLVAAGPLACLISATIGHAVLVPTGIIPSSDVSLSWWSWWIGDTFGVLICAPLTLTVLLGLASSWRERLLVLVIPMLVTLALVTASFVGVSRWEDRQIRERVARHGQEIMQHLERRLVAHQEALASLKRLLEVKPDMDFHEFEYFTRSTVSDNKDIFALSYNPCVRPETRARIERFFAEKGPGPDYRIMERDANKQLIPAGNRDLYVSVGFIAPLEGNRPAIGFDINSEPLRHNAIDRAIRSGHIAVTAPLRLVQENQPRVGVLVLVPAYRQDVSAQGEAAGGLFAFAVGVFKVDEMVRLAVGDYLASDLVLRITDPGASPEQRLLFVHGGEQSAPVPGYAWNSTLTVADRIWDVEVVPTAAFLGSTRSWLALGVGCVGLLFATLLQITLLSMIGRTTVIRQTVEEQTVALAAAKDSAVASQSRLLSLTEAARDAILMMDPQGKIAFWNPAAEQILGFTPDEALGRDLHELLAPERFHPGFHEHFPEFLRTGRGNVVGQTVELSARCKDGREIPISLSLSSAMIDGAWHAVGLLRDISQLKKHEAELLDAKEAAEAATVAKSRFLANMSHEIRTPMNGIIGMTGLLLDTELDDEQRLYASVAHSSGESLLTLVSEILDFSKLEARKLSLETLDFNLPDLMDDLCASVANRAGERGLELICDTDPTVPLYLRGDPGRLRQILGNLLGNALKFTHEGEVIVRAVVSEERSSEVLIRFSVHDTGIGIADNGLDLLFQKFSQVDASMTRQYGGTGLGLAISKQLVELLGGEIGVISQPGKGSEFWFTVRFDRVPASEEITPADLPSAPSLEGLRGQRILVVDDNAASRGMLVRLLTTWGLRPAEAPDGPSALHALFTALDEGAPFSLALVDARMPGLDGEALCRAVRANGRLDGLRMVLMVYFGERGDRSHFHTLGFAGTVLKPIRQHELKGALVRLAPVSPEHAASPVAASVPAVRESDPSTPCRGRVLLVEDNPTNQLVALGLLKRFGASTRAVANGLEALTILSESRFDLVLMDVQMPEMDGYEATRRVRAQDPPTLDPTVPIIAVTAHATVEDSERCLAAGMNDYVSKPVTWQVLSEMLERWLPVGPAVFNGAVLKAGLLDDEEMVRTVLDHFLEDTPRLLAALEKVLLTGDAAAVERAAHEMKGTAAAVGGEAFRAAARDMEGRGAAGDLAQARSLFPEMRVQFERLKAAILSAR